MSITATYRPRAFSEVVGQGHVKPVLMAMVRSGDVPPALLFYGFRGTGKTTVARIFAAALNCQNTEKGDACGECESCVSVFSGSSQSVLEIDAASNGGVADVRYLRDHVAYAHAGDWRVVILDEAHSMSTEAFNALLKLMEEPPDKTVFVLVTTHFEHIIPTVKSRSMQFDFRRLSSEQITKRLEYVAEQEGWSFEPDLIAAVSNSGSVRDSLLALDQAQRLDIQTSERYREVFGNPDISEDLLDAAKLGEASLIRDLLDDYFYRSGDLAGLISDLTSLIRELIVFRSGGTLSKNAQRRSGMATRASVPQLVKAVKILWELRMKQRQVESDPRGAADMALILISDALADSTDVPIQKVEKPQAEARLTLEQMQAQTEG